jgi:drug/metabolite transporter (DMT)-like permease
MSSAALAHLEYQAHTYSPNESSSPIFFPDGTRKPHGVPAPLQLVGGLMPIGASSLSDTCSRIDEVMPARDSPDLSDREQGENSPLADSRSFLAHSRPISRAGSPRSARLSTRSPHFNKGMTSSILSNLKLRNTPDGVGGAYAKFNGAIPASPIGPHLAAPSPYLAASANSNSDVPLETADEQPPPTGAVVAVELAAKPDVDDEYAAGTSIFRPGIIALCIAGAFYSAVIALNVFLSKSGMHPFQVAYYRAFWLATSSFGGLLYFQEVPIPKNKDGAFVSAWLPVIAGAFGNFDAMLSYSAGKMIPLSEVVVLRSISPVFATIFNRIIQGDKITAVRATAVLTFVVGAAMTINLVGYFVNGGESDGDAWLGRGLAAASALVTGMRITLVRRMSANGTTHYYSAGFWTGFAGVIVTGVTSIGVDFKPAEVWWLYLVAIGSGLSAAMGQTLTGFAAQRENAVVVGVLWNMDIPFTLFWQPVLFGNAVRWFQIVGVAIVLAAAMFIACENKIMQSSFCKPPDVDDKTSSEDNNPADHQVAKDEGDVELTVPQMLNGMPPLGESNPDVRVDVPQSPAEVPR